MKLPLYWVDSFTDRVGSGNPAAVVPLEQWLPDSTLQTIAFENGLSETAFLVPSSPGRYHLRWFTPATEVDLCGHATLASAHVLFRELGAKGDSVVFDSRSGPLSAILLPDGRVELDFPAVPVETEAHDLDPGPALGITPSRLFRAGRNVLCVYEDPAQVDSLKPDFSQLANLASGRFAATAPGGADCDFVSRFFAPGVGIPEDPVTGSIHCTLTPFWAARLGRTSLVARQLSARGGLLWCTLDSDRVRIAGRVTPYLRGEIQCP